MAGAAAAVPVVTSIPKLQNLQKVKDWRKLYIASTSLLTEAQKISFLPVYAARNQAEVLIAETCATKATIVEALNDLESLIDGPSTTLGKFNDFWDCKPCKRASYQDLISFYFVLKSEGAIASIPNHMIMMRFLNFIPGAEKIFEANNATIVEGMTTAQMDTVFKVIQQKLVKVKSQKNDIGEASGSQGQVIIKQEMLDHENHVFLADETEEEAPSWAKGLCNEVSLLKSRMEKLDVGISESDEVLFVNGRTKRPSKDRGQGQKSKVQCWICKEVGHYSHACPERKCSKCGYKGHHEKFCTYSSSKKPNQNHQQNKRGYPGL